MDTVQSKVPPDHNENNLSDITPISHNGNEHKPKPKPVPRKFYKSAKPAQSPLGHIKKPIPKPSLKPSQAHDLPSVPIDFQTTSSAKEGCDKKHINLSDLLQDKINVKELTPLKDIQPIEEHEIYMKTIKVRKNQKMNWKKLILI